uniref:T cell receptor beta variable 27 n=1 Tax=Prolemur simus TaxID=1328070 RepID=A0A8C8YDF6_PROSS
MGPQLLGCVVLCLLGAVLCLFLSTMSMDAGVTQTPRHLIKRTGERVLLECSQDMDHERMFWYRQDPGLGLRLIYFSYDVSNEEKGDVSEGYSASRKKKEGFPLVLESASTSQTSVYLCSIMLCWKNSDQGRNKL